MSEIFTEIKINKLSLYGYHGLLKEEQEKGQKFEVDASYKIAKNNFNDDISETVDYTEVIRRIESYFNGTRFNLLEELVNNIAEDLINTFPDIISVKIQVSKITPPIKIDLKSVSARCVKKRKKAIL